MGVLKLKLTTARSAASLTQVFERVGPNHAIAQACSDFINSIQTGTELAQGTGQPPSIAIIVQGNEVYASNTLTATSVIATNTITINGVVFTCMASGATGNQFNVGGTDTITMANAAAAINASVTALVSGYVTATSSTNVLTLTSAFPSLAGNMTTLAASGTMVLGSASRFTGGAADATAQTLSF